MSDKRMTYLDIVCDDFRSFGFTVTQAARHSGGFYVEASHPNGVAACYSSGRSRVQYMIHVPGFDLKSAGTRTMVSMTVSLFAGKDGEIDLRSVLSRLEAGEPLVQDLIANSGRLAARLRGENDADTNSGVRVT